MNLTVPAGGVGANGWHQDSYEPNLEKLDAHDHTSGKGSRVPEGGLSLSDVTTGDVNTSKHGFAPKLPNDDTKYLNGVGQWTVPPGGGGTGDVVGPASSVDGNVVLFDGVTGKLIKDAGVNLASKANAAHTHVESDLALSDVTTGNVSGTRHGFMPKLPNLAQLFLNGAGQWVYATGLGSLVSFRYEFGDGVNPIVNGSMRFHIPPFAVELLAVRIALVSTNGTGDIKMDFLRQPFVAGAAGDWTFIAEQVHAVAGSNLHFVNLVMDENWQNRELTANTVLAVSLTQVVVPGISHVSIDIEAVKT
jgi:hypothetical protein